MLPNGPFRSYPTYEEWKRSIWIKLGSKRQVLILPMRNGNSSNKSFTWYWYKFLSYLWGMETFITERILANDFLGSYPTYEEWKPSKMNAILAFIKACSYPTYEEWKQSSAGISMPVVSGSYPTYEEWKPTHIYHLLIWYNCSYPTYEEWKHHTYRDSFYKFYTCSYPTYEEWKLSTYNPSKYSYNFRSYPTYEEWKQFS